jgi:DNA-binding SARP family transcriptional activator/TolB-like protein
MFSLNLLGGAGLRGRNGPVEGRAAHRRRVALLSILAAARGRTVGREKIVGLLWADHSASGARHLLSESLYVLRKELGADAFVSAGDEVGLNGEVVKSDLEAFERAIEEGALEEAARLYRGPFLEGFFVPGAAEFEQWAEAERARLARAHSRALECLAAAREGEGRYAEAAEWWRRLVVLDPYNSRVGTRLMLALDLAGERAAALWFAETHTAFLRDELGVEPEEDFEELVERLRTEPVRVPLPEPAAPAPDAARADAAAAEEAAEEDPDAEPAGAAEPPAPAGLADQDPAAWEDAPESELSGESGEAAGAAEGRRRRGVRFAGAFGVMAGVVASILSASQLREPEAQLPSGHDPRRIAVLYFDDHSPDGKLGHLADGLTESLIQSLTQVEALDVVSRNGVKPYRDRPVRFDSMVADLRVGSVVEGAVQRSGDSIRVTVHLTDAHTKSHLESRTVVHLNTELFTLEDALAEEVSRFLRSRLGREVELRQTRAETRSSAAWERVMQAEELRDAATTVGPARERLDAASADRMLARADSLLALAERDDPAWTRPVLLRGWIALRRSMLHQGRRKDALLDAAVARAERVVAREPRNPRALELRGTAVMRRSARAPHGAAEIAGLARAERDLRAATTLEPSLASAWSTLSMVLRYRGHFAESGLAARRALQEDAYLEDAPDVLHRLFFGALLASDYREASAQCDEGRRRFPADWRFTECRLTLLREDPSRPPDAARALGLVAELDRLDPPARARSEGRGYSPLYRRAVAAAILARTGARDSARAVLARARAAAGSDPELRLSLDYDEAYVRLLLGERDAARRLLEGVLARRPALRPFAARDPLFAGLLRTK